MAGHRPSSGHPWRRWIPNRIRARPASRAVLPAEDGLVLANGHSRHPDHADAPRAILEAVAGIPESILCIPSDLLDVPEVFSPGRFLGVRRDAIEIASRLFPSGVYPHHFRTRTAALESDPDFKQIVACAVPWHEPSRSVWTFRRGATEGRLHGRLSCIPGGHISLIDAWPDGESTSPVDLLDASMRGVIRELGEEMSQWEHNWKSHHSDCRLILQGVINDDSDPVGQCHIGILYRLDMARRESMTAFPALAGNVTDWIPVDAILEFPREEVESWTSLVCGFLAESIPARSAP